MSVVIDITQRRPVLVSHRQGIGRNHHAYIDQRRTRVVRPAHPMTESAAVISDPLRVPVIAERREAGGIVIRRGGRYIALSEAELDRLVAFVRNEPPKARLQRFAILRPDDALASPAPTGS
jgi:hypothetical protein